MTDPPPSEDSSAGRAVRVRGGRRRGSFDVAIVGGGVVGTAVARLLSHHDLRVVLLEAGADVGAGTSKANTAVLHTGFDATPGTVESRLVRRGYDLLRAYAPTAGIAVEEVGAVLVAWDDAQDASLPALQAKAEANGYRRTELIDAEAVYDLEPALGPGARGGLLVPDEHIIDPWTTPLAFATEARVNGVEVRRATPVTEVRRGDAGHELQTPDGRLRCRFLVNAAGLHGDDLHRALGHDSFTIRPRRGELIVFDKLARGLIGRTILPVPTPTTKGVLVAPTVFGNVMLGPTADDVEDRSSTGSTRDGLDRLMAQGRRILPALVAEEVTAVYAGLRAATEHQDYVIELHVRAGLPVPRWHPLDRADGIDGHRRGGRLTAGRRRARAAPEGARPADRRAAHRLGRAGGASVPGRRHHRLPLRAGDRGGDHRRVLGPHRGGRPGRCAAPDACARRALPGLLLHGERGWPGVRRHGPDGGPAGGVGAVIDVLVVGGGPAGLSAATQLRRAGAGSVMVVEREREAGGIPRHTDHTGYGGRDLHRLLSGPAYARRLVAAATAAGVEVVTRAAAVGWVDDLALALATPDGERSVVARAVVLATGTRERPRAARLIPGDRPAGVLTTGSLQQLAMLDPTAVGRRAVVVGAEHVSFSAVSTLAHAGCRTVALVTDLPRHQTYAALWAMTAGRHHVPVWTGVGVARIIGRRRVEAVELTDGRQVACDTVVLTGDWFPDHELSRLGGLGIDRGTHGPAVDGALRTDRPGVFAAGNLLHGAETADVCALDGRHVAASVGAWLASGEWPGRGVAIAPEPPVRWIHPAVVRPAVAPPRSRYLLRVDEVVEGRRLSVTQGARLLWTGRSRGPLVPNRSISLPSGWEGRVDSDGPALTLTATDLR